MKRGLFLLLCIFWCGDAAVAQWKPQSSGTSAEFRGVSAVGAAVVWAVGVGGRIAKYAGPVPGTRRTK